MAVKQLFSMGDLDEILAQSHQRPVLVFKHSTTCPISAAAHRAWEEFLGTPEATEIGTAMVRVIEERPVSLALSERVGVRHQSPQAMLIRSGKAVWNDSHWAITTAALKSAARS